MKVEEINKKAYEKYPAKLAVVDLKGQEPRQIDLNEEARNAYIEAYKEISSCPTIKGWVARDMKKQALYFYTIRPTMSEHVWTCPVNSCCQIRDKKAFPDLKWEDEPIEVELPIIRK